MSSKENLTSYLSLCVVCFAWRELPPTIAAAPFYTLPENRWETRVCRADKPRTGTTHNAGHVLGDGKRSA